MNGPTINLVEALEQAGEPPEVIEAAKERAAAQEEERQDYAVMSANWTAVLLFVALQTQWDRAGIEGRRCGLRYDRIESVIKGRPDIAALDDYPILFPKLQIMELAALSEMNK